MERFRAYLGQQLCSPANVIEHPSGRREAAPIVTIYLLGYDLGLSDEAVLDVCPRATERRTGAEIDAGHPFIAGIHHRGHIVQIPRLRGRRRDELERVLSITASRASPASRAPSSAVPSSANARIASRTAAVSSPSCASQARAASRYVLPTSRSWISATASARNISHSTAQTARIARRRLSGSSRSPSAK